jgi:hypothetical protein
MPAKYGIIVIDRPVAIDGNGVGASIEATSGVGVQAIVADVVEIRHLAIHVANGCNCNGIYTNAYVTYGIIVYGGSAITPALIERTKLVANITGPLVNNNPGFAATARISDCVITGNTTWTSTLGTGPIPAFRNNAWAGNATDGATPFSISLK